MSVSEDSNNKPPLPLSPAENKCIRHHKYYYEDGSTVFRAGSYLFRFQASLLRADRGVKGYKFEAIMKRRLKNSPESNDCPGSSDSNPIILPVNASRFTALLVAVLGGVGTPVATGILIVALQPKSHTPGFFLCNLDIGLMASYFGMKTLESWAWQQVRTILELPELVAASEWAKSDLEDLAEYLNANEVPEFQYELLAIMQSVLSRASLGPHDLPAEHRTTILLFCVELYKSQALATSNPALFGFVFTTILSLGHRSPFWTEHLTRDDRTILYAAHVDLTKLSTHDDLDVKWLVRKTQVRSVCSATLCSQTFDRIWNTTFAQCKRLDSVVPLEDIIQILILPKHRFAFAKESSSWKCQSGCAQKSLQKIDTAMNETFCGFTKKHEQWTRDA